MELVINKCGSSRSSRESADCSVNTISVSSACFGGLYLIFELESCSQKRSFIAFFPHFKFLNVTIYFFRANNLNKIALQREEQARIH